MTKPINFRPSQVDQALIDALMNKGQYKNVSSLLRMSLLTLSESQLTDEERKTALLEGYEKELLEQ